MRIDFNFDETEDENGERIIYAFRIDTRHRPNDNVVFSDDQYDRNTNPHGWHVYVSYSNTSHPCGVNVDNPNNDPEITRRNRQCSIATIWPNKGPGEYEARIVSIARVDGRRVEGPNVVIQSKGIEAKPGKATSLSATGAADPNGVDGAFNVSWVHADRAAGYIVQWIIADSGSFDNPGEERVGRLHSAGIGDLEPNTAYLVRVIAVATFGREGDPTDAVRVTTGGSGTATITTPTEPDVDALVDAYDDDNDGVISLAEANAAVAAQVAGTITAAELYALLDFYFNQ